MLAHLLLAQRTDMGGRNKGKWGKPRPCVRDRRKSCLVLIVFIFSTTQLTRFSYVFITTADRWRNPSTSVTPTQTHHLPSTSESDVSSAERAHHDPIPGLGHPH